MEISSGIATQLAQTRNELATNAVKQSAEQDRKIADVLDTAASSVPNSPVRGTNVNIKV